MFSSSDYSNTIKIGYLPTYENIFQDPYNLFIGQGLGAETFFSSTQEYMSTTELTYIEIVRYYGLPCAILLIASLIYITYRLCKSRGINNHLSISTIIYLISAALNPYLFSSTGLLLITLAIGTGFKKKNEEI